MKRLTGVGAILFVMAFGVDASATDLPYMTGAGSETDTSTTLFVQCSRLGRDKASCTIVRTFLMEPKNDPAEPARRAAKLEWLIRSKEADADFKKTCVDLQHPSPEKKRLGKPFDDQARAACTANDPRALWDTFRRWGDEVGDRTCKLSVYTSRVEFTEVNSNTWRSIDTSDTCGATMMQTLSRTSPSGLWVYDSTRTVSPASLANPLCKNPLGGDIAASVTYGRYRPGPRELRCRYWDGE